MRLWGDIVRRILFVFLVMLMAVSNPSVAAYHKAQPKVAVLYIATGKYIQFWDRFYQAAEQYFLPDSQKTYFLFTDQAPSYLDTKDNIVIVPIQHEPWPFVTLKRYHFFISQKEVLKDFDYIYFTNANLIFQSVIGDEILPTQEQGLMVTKHPGYYQEKELKYIPYDRNPKSIAKVGSNEGQYYFMGGFNGGTARAFLELAETIKNWTDFDLSNNVIPRWHDESMLNRYMIDYMANQKPLILLPNYAIPEEKLSAMSPEFQGNIKGVLLDKRKFGGHNWIRQVSD